MFARAMLLMTVLLIGGCASEEEIDPNAPVPTVKAQLNFSLPSRIVGKRLASTRMTGDVVQESNKEADFRGIADVHLFCFDQYPTESSTKLGGIVDVKTSGEEVTDDVTTDDYSLCQPINIPVGTSYFGFYARADDAPKTHEERMKYGTIETVGLGKNTYQGNSGIRFRPVQICTSKDILGGSVSGQALLNLLNYLMNITVNVAAPNDRWSTAENLYLNEAYQRMTQLTTLSSYNVEVMLGFILKLINQEAPDNLADKLVSSITKTISESCDPETVPDIENGVIKLKASYQGFPADINLPEGAARIKWDAEELRFVVPDKQEYGNDLNVTSVNDYVYPMNLQYQVFSDILASEDLVILKQDEESATVSSDNAQYSSWQNLLNEGYVNADKKVGNTTQSVAMVQQVEYAVGRLSLRSRIGTDSNIYDAAGKVVGMYDGIFTLKGYIVGGQREVDYNFQPVPSSRTYAIYDTDLNDGPQKLKRHYFSEPDYILGLGTMADNSILVALELVNNGPAFQGADGVIVKGATFYLVANMNPKDSEKYSSGSLDKVFCKDRATQVYITINSLANATYGLPNLDIPRPTLGLSVDLSWGEGLWFDDIEL